MDDEKGGGGELARHLADLDQVLMAMGETMGPLSREARGAITRVIQSYFERGQRTIEHACHDLRVELERARRERETHEQQLRDAAREMMALRKRIRELEQITEVIRLKTGTNGETNGA